MGQKKIFRVKKNFSVTEKKPKRIQGSHKLSTEEKKQQNEVLKKNACTDGAGTRTQHRTTRSRSATGGRGTRHGRQTQTHTNTDTDTLNNVAPNRERKKKIRKKKGRVNGHSARARQ